MQENYFAQLNRLNFSDKLEKKNDLLYLPWAVSWGAIKTAHPLSFYTIYENDDGWNYFTDGRTCWVKTGVTMVFDDGASLEHVEYLPVMDYRNTSIPLDKVTSKDVNTSIQRSLTKAAARHGVGLYVYAKESSSEEIIQIKKKIVAEARKRVKEGMAKEQVSAAIADLNNDNPNPNSIEDLDIAEKVYAVLVSMTKKEKTK